ncbi:hypothetical protein NUTIK01_04960 [Novosphingobium sp. IK01]|jgi:AcrR family transcriptional regulator|uniref:HTH tetR-type domain-containing protein n=2 Tax=Novosphingobium pituita TaxID=3056842 RepID=A0ABQ6P589_9SPHN|nr:hypothetical protein NUTIK01_04960 [Novosphingobium sp. IK01]
MVMPHTRKGPYGPSEKRETTRARNMEKIEAAAWKVFASIGLDGATVRDIVTQSDVSAGSFYNYFGTKEAVFGKLIADLVDRVRIEVAQARAKSAQVAAQGPDGVAVEDVEAMLARGYRVFMDVVLAIPEGPAFFEKNQHHIRSRLFGARQIDVLMADIAANVDELAASRGLSPGERQLLSAIIYASGTEALFVALRSGQTISAGYPDFLAQLLARGFGALIVGGQFGARPSVAAPAQGLDQQAESR